MSVPESSKPSRCAVRASSSVIDLHELLVASVDGSAIGGEIYRRRLDKNVGEKKVENQPTIRPSSPRPQLTKN